MADNETIRTALMVVQTVFAGAAGIYAWIIARTKSNRDEIEAVSREVSELSDSVARLEARIESMPSHRDIGALHEKINGVGQSVNRISGELVGVNKTLGLIHRTLIEGRKP